MELTWPGPRSATLALGLALALLAGCGERSAPPTSALPVIPGARVVAAADGGSAVDTAYDHRRYRYLVVSGAVGESGLHLLESEPRFALDHGWRDEVPRTISSIADRCGVVDAVAAPITAPGVSVSLDSPSKGDSAEFAVIANQDDARQQEDGTPLYGNAAIDRALAARRPVLAITLGRGTGVKLATARPARRAACP